MADPDVFEIQPEAFTEKVNDENHATVPLIIHKNATFQALNLTLPAFDYLTSEQLAKLLKKIAQKCPNITAVTIENIRSIQDLIAILQGLHHFTSLHWIELKTRGTTLPDEQINPVNPEETVRAAVQALQSTSKTIELSELTCPTLYHLIMRGLDKHDSLQTLTLPNLEETDLANSLTEWKKIAHNAARLPSNTTLEINCPTVFLSEKFAILFKALDEFKPTEYPSLTVKFIQPSTIIKLVTLLQKTRVTSLTLRLFDDHDQERSVLVLLECLQAIQLTTLKIQKTNGRSFPHKLDKTELPQVMKLIGSSNLQRLILEIPLSSTFVFAMIKGLEEKFLQNAAKGIRIPVQFVISIEDEEALKQLLTELGSAFIEVSPISVIVNGHPYLTTFQQLFAPVSLPSDSEESSDVSSAEETEEEFSNDTSSSEEDADENTAAITTEAPASHHKGDRSISSAPPGFSFLNKAHTPAQAPRSPSAEAAVNDRDRNSYDNKSPDKEAKRVRTR